MLYFAFYILLLDPAPPAPHETDAWIADLRHHRYTVWNTSATHLVNAGRSVLPKLKQVHPEDPVVAQRIASIQALILKTLVSDLQPVPQIDAAWWDIKYHKYDTLRCQPDMFDCIARVKLDQSDWRPYACMYQATELWLRKRLEAGASPTLLRFVLTSMHRRDYDFYTYNAKNEQIMQPLIVRVLVDADKYAAGGYHR